MDRRGFPLTGGRRRRADRRCRRLHEQAPTPRNLSGTPRSDRTRRGGERPDGIVPESAVFIKFDVACIFLFKHAVMRQYTRVSRIFFHVLLSNGPGEIVRTPIYSKKARMYRKPSRTPDMHRTRQVLLRSAEIWRNHYRYGSMYAHFDFDPFYIPLKIHSKI